MRFKLVVVLAGIALIAASVLTVVGQEAKKEAKAEHAYIGAAKCALKPCHGNDGTYDTWAETAHAKAFDKLTDEQKKDPKYLKYYTTGTTAKGELLEGVQCEACHGAGDDYKSLKIMKDQEAAIANGLIIPTAETCKSCHNAEAPEAVAAIAKDFDMEKLKAKGVHAIPEKK